jgi:hypothetical protein
MIEIQTSEELGMRTTTQVVPVICKLFIYSHSRTSLLRLILAFFRPAHSYTYPFEPNPEWSQFYASAPEILQYFKGFATKYDLYKYVQLNSRILSAIWDEEKGICKPLFSTFI